MTDVMKIVADVRSESATAVMAGFSFASAIAWMDFVRFALSQLVKVPKNGAMYYLLTAMITTLLAVVAFSLVPRLTGVQKPKDKSIVYAVGA